MRSALPKRQATNTNISYTLYCTSISYLCIISLHRMRSALPKRQVTNTNISYTLYCTSISYLCMISLDRMPPVLFPSCSRSLALCVANVLLMCC